MDNISSHAILWSCVVFPAAFIILLRFKYPTIFGKDDDRQFQLFSICVIFIPLAMWCGCLYSQHTLAKKIPVTHEWIHAGSHQPFRGSEKIPQHAILKESYSRIEFVGVTGDSQVWTQEYPIDRGKVEILRHNSSFVKVVRCQARFTTYGFFLGNPPTHNTLRVFLPKDMIRSQ